MIWVDVALVVLPLLVLALVGLVLWRKVKAALRTGRDMQERAGVLAAQAAALGERLDTAALPER